MDQGEVGRPTLADRRRIGLAKELAAAPGRRGERLPGLQTRRDQLLDLPRELVGPRRAATEIGPGRDRDARGPVREADALRALAGGRGSRRPRRTAGRRRRGTSPTTEGPRASRRGTCRSAMAAHTAVEHEAVLQQSTRPATPARAPGERTRVRRDRAPRPWARRRRAAPRLHTTERWRVRPVEVQLHEVRAVVELPGPPRGARPRRRPRRRGGRAAPFDGEPCAPAPDVGEVGPAPPAVADTEASARSRPTNGIGDAAPPRRGPTGRRPTSAGGRSLGDLEQSLGRVDRRGRSSGRRQAASGGCGRRPCRARTSGRSRRRARGPRGPDPLVIPRSNPPDHAVLDEDADTSSSRPVARASASAPSRYRRAVKAAPLPEHLERPGHAPPARLLVLRAFDVEHDRAAVAVGQPVEERRASGSSARAAARSAGTSTSRGAVSRARSTSTSSPASTPAPARFSAASGSMNTSP